MNEQDSNGSRAISNQYFAPHVQSGVPLHTRIAHSGRRLPKHCKPYVSRHKNVL